MDEKYPPVHLIELEDRIVPDNSFDEAYAIYFRLSYEPPLRWQDEFEATMRREIQPKIVSFVGPSLRVVITRMEHLENLMRQINELVRKTNIELDFMT